MVGDTMYRSYSNEFQLWCQKVLPLVYDDSLSYYEVICKLTKYISGLTINDDDLKKILDEYGNRIGTLEDEVNKIMNGDYSFIYEIISKAIKNVFFGLTQSGYFVAYIPDSWSDITFNTTGYDIETEIQKDYGHLVLSY